MEVPFSSYLTEKKEIFRALVQTLSRDFTYVSLLCTDRCGTRYEVRRNQVSVLDSRWNERGCVARVHDGTGYAEYSFNEPSGSGGETAAVEARSRLARPLPGSSDASLPRVPYPVLQETPLRRSWRGQVKVLPEAVSTAEKIRRLAAVRDRAFGSCPSLVDIRVLYEEVTVSKLFLSGSRELEQSYLWSQGYLVPLVRRDALTRYLYRSFSGLKGVELVEEMERELAATLDIAEELLQAERVRPGVYEVILSPEVAGLLAHEAFGHGVEMDMFVKGRARAAEYLGKPVASPLVTMHDGARAAEQVASYWFDDEGTLGMDTLIIDRGVFRTGISDLLSALSLNTSPTGNGQRESFERKAYARMTNTFFSSGTDRLEDMIASIKHGYLLEKFLSGMEDPKNWGLQGVILYAREIAEGKLTGRIVSPVIMTGYVPEVLQSVSMLSPAVVLGGSGMCGKGHKEYVKTSTGGPYLKCVLRLG